MKILYINACAREESRTKQLAEHVLKNLGGEYEEIDLYAEGLRPLNRESLAERDRLLADEAFDHPRFAHANRFAAADLVVVAAPYWDLAFPAVLKDYVETVNCVGITFAYRDDAPYGLCRAKKMIYVVSAGGIIGDNAVFGSGYFRALAEQFYEIPEFIEIRAEGLDLEHADPAAILAAAHAEIDRKILPLNAD